MSINIEIQFIMMGLTQTGNYKISFSNHIHTLKYTLESQANINYARAFYRKYF